MYLMRWIFMYYARCAVPLSIWWRILVLVCFCRKLLARRAVINFSSLLHTTAHPPPLPRPRIVRTLLIDFSIITITTTIISGTPLYLPLLCHRIRTKKKVSLPRSRPLRLLVTWGKFISYLVKKTSSVPRCRFLTSCKNLLLTLFCLGVFIPCVFASRLIYL